MPASEARGDFCGVGPLFDLLGELFGAEPAHPAARTLSGPMPRRASLGEVLDKLPRDGRLRTFAAPPGVTARSGELPREVRDHLRGIARENAELRRRVQRTPQTVAVRHAECLDLLKGAARDRRLPRVSFASWTTGDALVHFAAQGARVCGLNFANGARAGGGYARGALAQEEDLCRRIPSLFTSLQRAEQQGLYPFGPSGPGRYADVLFTPSLLLVRRNQQQGFQVLPEAQWSEVSLVSAAAPNVKAGEPCDEELLYRAVLSILAAPKHREPETTTLVLGAWGCGAFGGEPAVVSELFARALAESGLGALYEEVHFAIPGGHNADVFCEALRRRGLRVGTVR